LRDGRLLEARTPDGQGGLACPLPPQAIIDKFRDNAGSVLPAARATEIEQMILGLDAVTDVRELAALLRG
jgi:hypothetical protein